VKESEIISVIGVLREKLMYEEKKAEEGGNRLHISVKGLKGCLYCGDQLSAGCQEKRGRRKKKALAWETSLKRKEEEASEGPS